MKSFENVTKRQAKDLTGDEREIIWHALPGNNIECFVRDKWLGCISDHMAQDSIYRVLPPSITKEEAIDKLKGNSFIFGNGDSMDFGVAYLELDKAIELINQIGE